MNVAILVPRRADHGRRDQLWRWVRARLTAEHPDWPIHEGHHDDGPFNRSAAINAAAAAAGDFDVAVVVDSDSFVGVDQAHAAVAAAVDHGQITFAYHLFAYLSRAMTAQIMDGFTGCWDTGIEWSLPGTCSSFLAVPRALWDRVGGFDEGFVGWGMEDIAFNIACQALGGGCRRIPGTVWHLWHPPSPENARTPEYHANVARLDRYADCDYDPAAVAALLAELAR